MARGNILAVVMKYENISIKWKILFWLGAGVRIVWLYFSFTMAISDGGWRLKVFPFELVLFLSMIIGVYGFSHKQKILNKSWWASILVIGMIYDNYIIIVRAKWQILDIAVFEYFGTGIIVVIMPIICLQYFALYLYAFKSENLWRN